MDFNHFHNIINNAFPTHGGFGPQPPLPPMPQPLPQEPAPLFGS
ncbi:hypothetical protein [Rhodococcus sp. Q]|nr:hypothetical protein [Rhodococcus sp. Q]